MLWDDRWETIRKMGAQQAVEQSFKLKCILNATGITNIDLDKWWEENSLYKSKEIKQWKTNIL
jgi:hypothetical protein